MASIQVCDTCCLNCTKEKCKMPKFECNKGIPNKCGRDKQCHAFTGKPKNEWIKEVPINE